ncbi:MAG: hypothetical protein JW932_07210 [Deltaproteobacteria bacterium]|nr:hypothetical protein [Deltaproteobacteria bacterium]
MGKKNKSKKNKHGLSSFISTEEQTRLESLLKDHKKINLENPREQIKGPEFALAFLERLPIDDPGMVSVISSIREHFNEKEVQKAVKKMIFRLKQRGISIPDPEDETPPVMIRRSAESPEPKAYLGVFDGAGNRGILIHIPQIPKDVIMGIGVISSEQGIDQFIYVRYSKKQAKAVQEIFNKQCGTVIETTVQHAVSILEKSYLKTQRNEATETYLQFRPWVLEHGPMLDHPIIHEFIPPESLSKEVLTESMIDKLLDHEFMQSWLEEPEKIVPILEEISSVNESLILVNGIQKNERIREIKEKAVETLYPETRRSVMKENLEEMAYLFYKLGQEEFARWSVLAASSMVKCSSLMVNLFLMALVDRSVEYYTMQMDALTESEKAGHDDSSGLILP